MEEEIKAKAMIRTIYRLSCRISVQCKNINIMRKSPKYGREHMNKIDEMETEMLATKEEANGNIRDNEKTIIAQITSGKPSIIPILTAIIGNIESYINYANTGYLLETHHKSLSAIYKNFDPEFNQATYSKSNE